MLGLDHLSEGREAQTIVPLVCTSWCTVFCRHDVLPPEPLVSVSLARISSRSTPHHRDHLEQSLQTRPSATTFPVNSSAGVCLLRRLLLLRHMGCATRKGRWVRGWVREPSECTTNARKQPSKSTKQVSQQRLATSGKRAHREQQQLVVESRRTRCRHDVLVAAGHCGGW